MTPRSALILSARAVVGLTAPDPRYLTLVAPGDTPARAAEVARESDCALVALGIQESALTIPPRGPYRDGSAFEVLYDRVGGNPWHPGGAMRLPTLAGPFAPGDALVWGASPAAPAHVDACVIEVVGEEGALSVCVVAGGQRDAAGRETVKVLQRALRWDGRRWVDAANGRALIGVVDADALAAMYPVRDNGDADTLDGTGGV